jgi:hypothetical protein
MARLMRKRHLRHGRYSRLRRSKDFIAFLNAEQADLDGTGTGVTITLSGGVAATVTLTLAANPTDADTMTIGGKTYRFKNTTAQANDIKIGASAAATILNIVAAVAASGTGDGTDYHTGTTANANVSAADGTGDTVVFSALVAGVAGNDLTAAETFTNAGNVFGSDYLSGGVDRYIFNKSTHGYVAGDGPFVITAATTIPGGYTAGELLWVKEALDAGTFTMTTKKGGTVAKTFTTSGTGTLTLTKDDSAESIHEILKGTKARVLTAATDVDNL